MALPSFATRYLDTMVSTAIDTYSKDPVNALTDSGEKFMKSAAQLGRIFMVNDSEAVRHPIMYGGGENSSLYTPDGPAATDTGVIDGDPAYNQLSANAHEVLTHARFELQAGTRNINFPQSQPPGNIIDYVSNVVKANMMEILNEEEILFLNGKPAASPGAGTANGAFPGDGDYSEGYPVSLPALLFGSSNPTSLDATGDTTAEAFGAIKTDDVARWQPYHVQADAAAGTPATDSSTMISDLQKAVLNATYSEVERPTHVYVTLAQFEKFLDLLRDSAALPDPVRTDMGKEGTIPFGGVTIDWSRYLKADVIYDLIDAENTTASLPIIGLNWNSLRLNTVRAGGISGDGLGFIRQIGDLQPHPLKSNVFKRIEWKRQWSVDNGRRSFFFIYGNETVA